MPWPIPTTFVEVTGTERSSTESTRLDARTAASSIRVRFQWAYQRSTLVPRGRASGAASTA